MNHVVFVHFFGKFCLESNTGYLDEETIHSRKILKLLAFLLLNHNRMIDAEELGDLIWGNGGSSNPTGALKNLIYRLRGTLKQMGPEEYIVSRSGTYGWNEAIEIRSDMEEFRYRAEQTRETGNTVDERIKKYEQALSCYEKPRSSVLISESWLAVRFTYYRSVYMKLVNELCELYDEIQDYTAIQKVCGYAMSFDEFSEDVHYWMIRSWVGMGNADRALKQYETAVEILYEKLGIHRSKKMKELYEKILGMNKNSLQATMDDIYGEIQEEHPEGVFFCEYTIFREIYRLEARRVLRSGSTEYMVLLTIEINERKLQSDPVRLQYYRKKSGMKLLQILKKYLRMGDVAARYSDEQYIVMLPYCDGESSRKVIKRILTNFKKDMDSKMVTISAETREVSINYELPSEGKKGGVTWSHERKPGKT